MDRFHTNTALLMAARAVSADLFGFSHLLKRSQLARKTLPIPLAVSAERRALARMFLELSVAFHETIFPVDQTPSEPDPNLAVLVVAVMLGHAEGHPMNAGQLASEVRRSRTTTKRRLDTLIELGAIECIKGKYYLEPMRARDVPHRDTFDLILSKAFAVLGPYLSKLDS